MNQEFFDDFSSESDSSPLDVFEVSSPKNEIDVSKLSRPPNSFLLFSNEQRILLRKQHPDLNNTEISRMLGVAWRALHPDRKKEYVNKAEKMKVEFLRLNPNYKFKRESKSGPKKSKYQIFKEKLAAGTISNTPRARSSSSIESPKETSRVELRVADPIIAVQKFPIYDPVPNTPITQIEDTMVYNPQLLDALADAKNILLDDSFKETSLLDSFQDFINSMDSSVSFNFPSDL